jgi:hypothetical protein
VIVELVRLAPNSRRAEDVAERPKLRHGAPRRALDRSCGAVVDRIEARSSVPTEVSGHMNAHRPSAAPIAHLSTPPAERNSGERHTSELLTMRRLLTITLLLVFALPSAAHAGRVALVKVNTDPKYGYEETVLSFTAISGEHNQIVLTRITANGGRAFVLHDDGAIVHAPASCTVIDEHTVSCAASSAFIDAGDGDDAVTLRHGEAPGDYYGGYDFLRGGDGADVLVGSGYLSGGAGDDVVMCEEQCSGSMLAGGAGSDRLRGSSEDEVLSGDGDGPLQPEYIKPELTESGAAGNDTIDGGAGVDEITFRGRSTDVSVDLAAGTSAGTGGEHDSIAGIESVTGGDGDDRLLGDAGDNTLQGAVGDDRIDGRGGNDYLLGDLVPNTNEYSVYQTLGNDGVDTLRGGSGNDRLDAGSERGDVLSGGTGADTLEDGINGATRAAKVRCGSGRDTITFAPQGQMLSDCERLLADSAQARFDLRPRLRAHGRLRFDWSCVQRYEKRCALGVGVRVGSTKLARRTVSLPRLTRGAFLLRPVRGARRGDVVDIRMAYATGGQYADGRPVLFMARWRMRL